MAAQLVLKIEEDNVRVVDSSGEQDFPNAAALRECESAKFAV